MQTEESWATQFPELFAPGHWPWGELDVRFTVEEPADELISNVHVICRTTGGIVVCGNDLGWRFLPGGRGSRARRSTSSSNGSCSRRPVPG